MDLGGGHTRDQAGNLKWAGDELAVATSAREETAASLHTDEFEDIKLLHHLNGEGLRKFLKSCSVAF